MEIEAPVRQILDTQAQLGEGVLWDAVRELVWFVDIKRQLLWRYDPSTQTSFSARAPAQIGWALPTEGDKLLCGLQDGLYTFHPETGKFEKSAVVPGEPAGNRLNDACTDPWGRIWFGSMDDSETSRSGRFYVYDRGSISAAGPAQITITNGPAVNAQGDRIFFTDTSAREIFVANLSSRGVGEVRLFADTSAHFPQAFPDGPVVDAEDHLWTGLYLGGNVARFSPDGELVAIVPMPARDITKLAFGGPEMRTAFVTTATKDMNVEDTELFPLGGSLLAFDAPVAGFAQPLAKL